ncbi:MAG TPA: hypothetical protein VFC86_11030 [Planctomycetota bacterium]|nr:hypothetical protein [Planctomycetota bacterium]
MVTLAWSILLAISCPQELSEVDKRVDELIERLKEHSVEATAAGFLKRPEMSRLMGLGPAAFPRLKHHFLTSEDVRIQASAGFLSILHAPDSDPEFVTRCKNLAGGTDVLVRAVMKPLVAEMKATCVLEMPDLSPEEKKIFDQIGFHRGVSWMAVEDLKTLVANGQSILKRGKVLVDPPVLDGAGMMGLDPNPKRLRSSGVRKLTPIARMAELSVGRALDSSKGHEVHDLVLQAVEADDGTDPARLGLLLRLGRRAVWHRNAESEHKCELFSANQRRLFALCERWAWKVTDPNAQYGVFSALDSIGLWKSYDLREKLSKDHPDEQVRELAGSNLNQIFNNLYDKGHTREMEKEEDERLKKADTR